MCIGGERDYMDNITTSRGTSVEELREEGNLIIYIWKATMICQVRRKHNRLEKLVKS